MATKKYKVVVAGMGKRGLHHALAFQGSNRFELSGISSRDQARLEKARAELEQGREKPGHAPRTSTDAASLAGAVRPDVFCFCTPPDVRLAMIETGIACGVRLIAFEKPIALSSAEAMEIRKRLSTAGVRAVVSHQHRYGAHYRAVKEVIDRGELGRIHTVYATGAGWMMHLASHLIDYMRWYNGEAEAEWVMAQASGGSKLADLHASPDYLGGFIQFANGVRGILECGAGAPDVPEVGYWWRKCRIGAQGTEGFAEVLTGGGWRSVTGRGVFGGTGCMNYDLDMPPYIEDVAAWLDDEAAIHPCNFESAYKGHEIMMALCRSAVEGGQVSLPLASGANEIELLRARLSDKKVRASTPENAKQYGL